MAGHSPTLITTCIASAAIPKRRIVKFGASDGAVVLAAGPAATEFSIGITTEIDAASGEPVDVIRGGIADVEYGGTVTRGGPITSDSTGRAVAAAPAAGVNNRCIGFAEVSAVVGDVGPAFIQPFTLQG